MPIIRSAKKQMRQSNKKRMRNLPVKNQLKTMVKKEMLLIKEGKTEEAAKLLPLVFSVIDTACKKNLIHPNNASRKKSRLARALNDLQTGKVKEVVATGKKAKKLKPAPVEVEA